MFDLTENLEGSEINQKYKEISSEEQQANLSDQERETLKKLTSGLDEQFLEDGIHLNLFSLREIEENKSEDAITLGIFMGGKKMEGFGAKLAKAGKRYIALQGELDEFIKKNPDFKMLKREEPKKTDDFSTELATTGKFTLTSDGSRPINIVSLTSISMIKSIPDQQISKVA